MAVRGSSLERYVKTVSISVAIFFMMLLHAGRGNESVSSQATVSFKSASSCRKIRFRLRGFFWAGQFKGVHLSALTVGPVTGGRATERMEAEGRKLTGREDKPPSLRSS